MLSACGSPEAESIVFNKPNPAEYHRNATRRILKSSFVAPEDFPKNLSFFIENKMLRDLFANTIKFIYMSSNSYTHIHYRHVRGAYVKGRVLPSMFVPGTNFVVFQKIIEILLSQQTFSKRDKYIPKDSDLLPNLKFSANIQIGKDIRTYYLILYLNNPDKVEIISVFPDYNILDSDIDPNSIYDLTEFADDPITVAKAYSNYTRQADKSNKAPRSQESKNKSSGKYKNKKR
jgi:hypothetical protein